MSLLQIHEPGQTPLPHADDVAIGIDLGTTHSVVAVSHDQQADVIQAADGTRLMPSVVHYGETRISSVKRLMGRGVDESKAVAQHLPYELMDDKNVRIKMEFGSVTPVEVSADILKNLKTQAEEALGKDVKQAVITVPAYFDDAARTATKDAAKLAGLEVLRLINEPTAAALAYGLDHSAEGIFAIYDLGGGTFDISILKLEQGVFQVLSTGGDTQLGGDDFDNALAEKLGISPLEARTIKEHLSDEEAIDGINREEFNALIAPLVQKSLTACEQAIRDASIDATDITGVVLVGGSTRIPYVREQVGELFAKPPLTNIDPDEVVAIGAAIQAEALTKGANHLLLDVTPLSLGLETMGGIVEKVIHRNTPIPVSAQQEFTTCQDGQNAMNIKVVQGEREMVEDCRELAEFTLKGIPPLPANVARIAVNFTVDADGLLTVSAEETTTGTRQEVEVKPSYGLEVEEIESMLRESMEHGKEDILKRLLIEARVEAERVIHDIQSAMKADEALLVEGEADKINGQIDILKQAIAGDDRDKIDYLVEQLNNLSNPFAARRMDKAIASALEGTHIDNHTEDTKRDQHA